MRNRNSSDRRCSYVVVVGNATRVNSDLRDLASYLSTLGVANCDVVILDASPRLQFDLNARILRWVGRHVAVRPEYRMPSGGVDVIRAAVAFAGCEKVIVATEDVRYRVEAVGKLCSLLDVHEVAEPQDYFDPLPWWGNLEASRMLVHRGVEPQPDHGATFAFRRTALRSLRGLASSLAFDDPVRRLAASGAEVYAASDVFVRREPGAFRDWLERRPRLAGEDFSLPMKSAFFFSLVPVLAMLAILGGLQLAAGYGGVIAFAAVGLALRGRAGASAFFPLHACLFAPLWVFERSISVYWALFRKLRGADVAATGMAMPVGARGEKVASGE
ncbi:MAG TPA: hypothetical protein VHW00_02135 [Thermoanaerobaculia bacterium]|nr:hypothetical protein [Thermoanaerobaculia bacterium]